MLGGPSGPGGWRRQACGRVVGWETGNRTAGGAAVLGGLPLALAAAGVWACSGMGDRSGYEETVLSLGQQGNYSINRSV